MRPRRDSLRLRNSRLAPVASWRGYGIRYLGSIENTPPPWAAVDTLTALRRSGARRARNPLLGIPASSAGAGAPYQYILRRTYDNPDRIARNEHGESPTRARQGERDL